MSSTDHCLLCYETINRDSVDLTLKFENREYQNGHFGGSIDMMILCDLLRVSVDAVIEKNMTQNVPLCSECEVIISEIKEILHEIKRLKRKLSRMMNIVKTKLHKSMLTCTPEDDYRIQFEEIRQGMLFDLSNILGLPAPLDISFIDIKYESPDFPINSENEKFQNTNNGNKSKQLTEANNINVSTEDCHPAQITGVQADEKLRKSSRSKKPLNKLSENDEARGKNDDIDNTNEYCSENNSDPDFSDVLSASEGGDNDVDYTLPRKRKSRTNYSPSKRKNKEVDMQKCDSGSSIKGQEEVQKPVQQKTVTKKTRRRCRSKIEDILSGLDNLDEDEEESNGDRFKCKLCRKTYKTRKILHGHIRRIHNGEGKNERRKETCDVCGKSVQYPGLKRHMLEVHEGKRTILNLKCDLCDNVYHTKNAFKLHKLTHSEDFAYHICSHCGKSFQTQHTLLRHERFHVEEKKQTCQVCQKSFHTASDLRIHMESHATERKHVCELCGNSFKYAFRFRWHMRMHKKIEQGEDIMRKCKYCEKPFKSVSGHRKHILKHHTDAKNLHQCTVCEKIFLHAYLLRAHIKTQHNPTNPTPPLV